MLDLDKAMRDLDRLDEVLREYEPVGGPLHVVVDDENVRDSDVLSCYRDLPHGDVVVDLICWEMIRYLMLMTEPQRAVWLLSRTYADEGVDRVAVAEQVAEGRLDLDDAEGELIRGVVVLRDGMIKLDDYETLRCARRRGDKS